MKRINFILTAVCLIFLISTGCIYKIDVLPEYEKQKITKPKIIFKETQQLIKKSTVSPNIYEDQTVQETTVSDSKTDENRDIQAQYNKITIPDVCTNSVITDGSTQEDVDKYDICLMTKAAAVFGEGKPILLGGHNTKSLKFLYRTETSNIIYVTYLGNEYRYEVIYSNECINDGYKLYDIKTGVSMLDYNLDQEIINIYTCYGNNNWLVKAIRI